MRIRTQAAVLVLCVIMLAAASIFGTVAYLTDWQAVTNTFTVGRVSITMDETDVDANGLQDSPIRVRENSYKLMPGHTYTKDPTIHVGANSEDCWLFVKVENQIAGIESDTTVAAQMAANGWSALEGAANVYAYKAIATAGEDILVFATFGVDGNVDNAALADYAGKTIVVTAYAVQADGFATAAAAWSAAFGN